MPDYGGIPDQLLEKTRSSYAKRGRRVVAVNWVEKGSCLGPAGYFEPKSDLYGAGAAYGVDAVGGVETLLHEVVHARTNLAIRDELPV